MNYALVENGAVVNVIWLYEGNAHEFANAVPVDGRPVQIGDAWDGEHFFHDGARVLTPEEALRAELAEMDEALLETVYQNAIGGLEE